MSEDDSTNLSDGPNSETDFNQAEITLEDNSDFNQNNWKPPFSTKSFSSNKGTNFHQIYSSSEKSVFNSFHHQPISSRPKPSQSKTIRPRTNDSIRSKNNLFQPSPAPLMICGPVFYYSGVDQFEKKMSRQYDEELKRKSRAKQLRSPYKENFVKLRDNSIRQVNLKFAMNEYKEARQRFRESMRYRDACQEEFENEERHCHTDTISRSYKELRIIHV